MRSERQQKRARHKKRRDPARIETWSEKRAKGKRKTTMSKTNFTRLQEGIRHVWAQNILLRQQCMDLLCQAMLLLAKARRIRKGRI